MRRPCHARPDCSRLRRRLLMTDPMVPARPDVRFDHNRRSIRLSGYDYTQPGAYFVTAVTRHRRCLFGDIVNGEMRSSDAGRLAHDLWEAIPRHFPFVQLDAFIVMPNHVHGILAIVAGGAGATHASPLQPDPHHRAGGGVRPTGSSRFSIGAIVGSYKSAVSRRFNRCRYFSGIHLWQRNYYEHVIRDERSLRRLREYITTNPERWQDDLENPRSPPRDLRYTAST